MLKNRMNAARDVAAALHGAEDALDRALILMAELTGSLPAARMEARLSAVIGQEVLDTARSALGKAIDARADLVRAHHGLAEVQEQMGLKALNYGGGYEKDLKATGVTNDEPVMNTASIAA